MIHSCYEGEVTQIQFSALICHRKDFLSDTVQIRPEPLSSDTHRVHEWMRTVRSEFMWPFPSDYVHITVGVIIFRRQQCVKTTVQDSNNSDIFSGKEIRRLVIYWTFLGDWRIHLKKLNSEQIRIVFAVCTVIRPIWYKILSKMVEILNNKL